MKNLQDYKKEAVLNKIIRFPEGLMTRREWLNMWRIKGAFAKEVQEPKVHYNRIKFNRLEGKAQEAYEKSCNEMKTTYRLYISERSSYDINKTEFEYFNSMVLADDLATEKSQLSENELMAKEFEFAAKYF